MYENAPCIDYIIRGHECYWNMLGGMRGIENHRGSLSWLSGDVNCIYSVKFSGLDYSKEVGEIAEKMRNGQLPDRLVILPNSAPPDVDIGELFLSHNGFSHGSDYGMAKELCADMSFPAPPKRINLFRVNEMHRLKASGAILNTAFEYDLFSFEHYLDAFNASYVHFYMAEYDGIPAGACMALWGDDFVEIAWVGTLNGYRKKGIAGYLVNMAERDAVEAGKSIAALSAFLIGINAYERAGFKKCCEIKVICYKPEK